MSSKLPTYLPSGDYVIYSLVDGPLGIAFITGAIDRVPVIVPSPGFYPQKFHVQLVNESEHIYVIKVDGKNTRDEENLKWVITYREQQNAYTIVKLNTNEAWTDPGQDRREGRRDPDDPRQGKYSDICASQLVQIRAGDYRIHSLVSNQPLGIQSVVGRRPDDSVIEPVRPPVHSRADPVIVPVTGFAPQTFTVQQVNGAEDTYVIRIEGKYTRDERNLVYAFQDPPAQEWVITYRENQGAYTIVKMRTGGAWTDPRQFPDNFLGQVTLPEGEQIEISDDEPDVPEGEEAEHPGSESDLLRHRRPPRRFRRQVDDFLLSIDFMPSSCVSPLDRLRTSRSHRAGPTPCIPQEPVIPVFACQCVEA
ncbi:hypothetical protein F5J12DRAFT_846283 [Pisolithus orientalis]|uniref:uncharacterized protein n=1 Tax=Pisolithus orientalis TaxID=936130 RepID=UPI00222412BE|nr:uncharacterized protein F5J12DRAFT_846283 [Pisolithus orientalis]KAI6000122.1 hypothetical protein F5J12DRAFT_846283 [Pisolithus orientalis]